MQWADPAVSSPGSCSDRRYGAAKHCEDSLINSLDKLRGVANVGKYEGDESDL